MKIADIPTKFNIPFGNSAGGGYIRAVPEASQIGITAGAASLTDGFPPLNFLPVGAGGVPPFGQDMNGILNQATAWDRYASCAGGLPIYDAAFSTAIGGYPRGAVISGTSAGVLWLNIADDNTSNPDTGGANWINILVALNQATTFWVRTDGNNNNNGSANTAGSAFKTIAGALAYIQRIYGTPNQAITIRLGIPGTYDTVSISGFAGTLTILGDIANQGSYILTGSSGLSVITASVVLSGITLFYASGAVQHNLQVGGGANVGVDHVTFSGVNQSAWAHIFASGGGTITVGSGNIFSSNAFTAMLASLGGVIFCSTGSSITFSSNPSFASATVVARQCGIADFSLVTFSGAATGKRYDTLLNGVINTNGGGANFIPGNSAGTTATGGQYA